MIILNPHKYEPRQATYDDPLGTKINTTYRQPLADVVKKEDGSYQIELKYLDLPVEVLPVFERLAGCSLDAISKQREMIEGLYKLLQRAAE